MPRVLLAQRDPVASLGIQQWLSRLGWEVFATPDLENVLHQVYELQPSLVLLELPHDLADPWATLRSLRELSDVPIMLLVDAPSEREQVMSLELGANDCVSMPFVAGEIEARAHAVMGRARIRPDRNITSTSK